MSKATDIIRDSAPGTGAQQQREMNADTSLVSWVMTRVRDWEDYRKNNYDQRWKEYYRMWRGFWSAEDKSRDSERSRLIHPALSQAVESTVAELEEAVFGQGKWFDVSDNYNDTDKTDIMMWRDQMDEDLDKEDVESALSEIFLNGCLTGIGVGKIVLNERTDKRIVKGFIGDSDVQTPTVEFTNVVRVGLHAVDPFEFVIDPTARRIDDALGMAHITTVPKHGVEQKQTDGTYRRVSLAGYNDTFVGSNSNIQKPDLKDIRDQDKTMIIEYHGFVPRRLLDAVKHADALGEGEPFEFETHEGEEMVEAIVTIANSSSLLRAVENPFLMGDRCFIAYQHDTVPNRFWGRGVCEKGYNPQKGLDAEMRGRIDAMALSIHPMMAVDSTRMARGQKLVVAPGRNVHTVGDPRTALMPFNFGQVNPTTFSQSADLERQLQMATGAMDSATPVGDNRRNETLGGMSIIQGASVKRTRRTMANIERRFIKPFVHKAAWRFMQFAPERYPVEDIDFVVHSTLGIMARELEQQQLANMLKTLPADSPAYWMTLKNLYELSDLSNREEMLEIADQMLRASMEKQANREPSLAEVKLREIEIKAEIERLKLQQKDSVDKKEFQLDIERLLLEQEELRIKREKMILDAKIALAGQEQDSLVTAAQMAVSDRDSQRKAQVQLRKGNGP